MHACRGAASPMAGPDVDMGPCVKEVSDITHTGNPLRGIGSNALGVVEPNPHRKFRQGEGTYHAEVKEGTPAFAEVENWLGAHAGKVVPAFQVSEERGEKVNELDPDRVQGGDSLDEPIIVVLVLFQNEERGGSQRRFARAREGGGAVGETLEDIEFLQTLIWAGWVFQERDINGEL